MTITIIIAQMCMSRGCCFSMQKSTKFPLKLSIPSIINTEMNLVLLLFWCRLGHHGSTKNVCNFATILCFFIFSLHNKYKIQVFLYRSVHTKKLIKMGKVSIPHLTPRPVLPFYVRAGTRFVECPCFTSLSALICH